MGWVQGNGPRVSGCSLSESWNVLPFCNGLISYLSFGKPRYEGYTRMWVLVGMDSRRSHRDEIVPLGSCNEENVFKRKRLLSRVETATGPATRLPVS